MKSKRISNVKDIKRNIKCPCGKGIMELQMFHIHPSNGKVALSYGSCSEPFCHYERGLVMFTDITISQLIIGE